MVLDVTHYLAKHRIIIDTSSLTSPEGLTWVRAWLRPLLQRASRCLVVPVAVHNELVEQSKDPDALRATRAREGLAIIGEMRRDQTAELFGDPAEHIARDVIVGVAKRVRATHDLLVITQNSELARELASIAHPYAACELAIGRVHAGGLEHWPKKITPEPQPSASSASFRGFARPAGLPNALHTEAIQITAIPAAGAEVTTSQRTVITLGDVIAEGGEGIVYKVGTDHVAKIYKPDRLSQSTLGKLTLMVQADIRIAGVCWPRSLLFNNVGKPVGYLMEKAAGFPLDTSVFKKPLLLKKLPNWKRTDLVQAAIKLCKIIDRLHSYNVILGDINPNNILVTPDGEITLVDLDSAQIENYPCPVGMVNFTRPHHHGKDYSAYLRDFDDDKFALAVMIFMILVPGKQPYAHAGGGEPGENVRKKHFPYALGEKKADGVPDGPWGLIWNHLSRKVKTAFYEVFVHDQLKPPSEWVSILSTYERAIRFGKMDAEQGNDIFPTRSKRLTKEVQEMFGIRQTEKIEFTCQPPGCGRPFEVPKWKVKQSPETPKHCPDCSKAMEMKRISEEIGAVKRELQSAPKPKSAAQHSPPPKSAPTSPRPSPGRPASPVTAPSGPPRTRESLLSIIRKILG